MRVRRLLISTLLGLAALAVTRWLTLGPIPRAHAATLTVNTLTDESDGSCSDGDCSLRDAVATASPGDTINFSVSGTIVISITLGPLTIDKDLTVDGPGADQLGISGNDASSVFSINSSAVTLTHLAVLQGNATDGGGIYISGNSTQVTLAEVSVISNSASDGGGLYVQSGSVILSGAQVASNTAEVNGGGIYIYQGKAMLNGGEIRSNTAISGGGAYADYGLVTLSGGQIVSNTASWGGGIYVYRGSMTLNGGQIVSNTGSVGGGVCIYDTGSVTFSGGEIRGNSAQLWGGGMYIHRGSMTLNGGQIVSNTATEGGGVYVYQGDAMLSGGQIVSNAAQYSAGIGIGEGRATLSGGEIRGNTASEYAGGVSVYNPSAVFTQTGVSTITHNMAQSGAGVCVWYGNAVLSGGQIVSNTAAQNGGGVYVRYGNLTLNGGQIVSNAANSGGGVYVDQGSATLSQGQIALNTAGLDGGGMFIQQGNATLNGAQITSNTASYGGGVCVYQGRATLSGGEVRGNAASDWGGGVLVGYDNAVFTQTGISTITMNTAEYGGGIYVHLARARLSGGRIAGNTASGYGSALYNSSGAVNTTAALTITGDIYQEGGTFDGGSQPLAVDGMLSLAGGTFTAPTGGFRLTGLFTHIGGTYRQTQVVTGVTPVGFPKEGGVIINANDRDLGSTEVVIRAGVDCTTVPSETVRHCYNITPTNASSISATITFYFNGNEIPVGQNCDTLDVYHWDAGWDGPLTVDTNGRNCTPPFSIRVRDVTDFSSFVIKGDGIPTAVILRGIRAHSISGGPPLVALIVLSMGGLVVLWRMRRRR